MDKVLAIGRLIDRCSGITPARSYNSSNTYISEIASEPEQSVYTLSESSSFHSLGPFILEKCREDFEGLIKDVEKSINDVREKEKQSQISKAKLVQQLNELARREQTVKPIQNMIKKIETFNQYDHDQKTYGVTKCLGIEALALPSRVVAVAEISGLTVDNSLAEEQKIIFYNDHLLIEIEYGSGSEDGQNPIPVKVGVSLTEEEDEVNLVNEAEDILHILQRNDLHVLEVKLKALIRRTNLMVELLTVKPPVKMRTLELEMHDKLKQIYKDKHEASVKIVAEGLQLSVQFPNVAHSHKGRADVSNGRVETHHLRLNVVLEDTRLKGGENIALQFWPPVACTACLAKRIHHITKGEQFPDQSLGEKELSKMELGYYLGKLLSYKKHSRENDLTLAFRTPDKLYSLARLRIGGGEKQNRVYLYSLYHQSLYDSSDVNSDEVIKKHNQINAARSVLLHTLSLKSNKTKGCDVDGALEKLQPIVRLATIQARFNLLLSSCFQLAELELGTLDKKGSDLNEEIDGNVRNEIENGGYQDAVKRRRILPKENIGNTDDYDYMYNSSLRKLSHLTNISNNSSDYDVLMEATKQDSRDRKALPENKYVVSVKTSFSCGNDDAVALPSEIRFEVRQGSPIDANLAEIVITFVEKSDAFDLTVTNGNKINRSKLDTAKKLLNQSHCMPIVIDYLLN